MAERDKKIAELEALLEKASVRATHTQRRNEL